MVKRRLGILILLLQLCLCMLPQYALAASTVDAKEPIVTDKNCTLTLSYGYGSEVFADVAVSVYKIADVSSDFQYTLTEAFEDSQLILNGIQTTGEWNVIRSTLEAYILINGTQADMEATTDESGKLSLDTLETGMYLIITGHVEKNGTDYFFDSALIALPGLGTDGLWEYDVAVNPKAQALPPIRPDETLELKVLKLWKGDENRTDRPGSVEVAIFRNGEHYQTVTLSGENNWSYSWSAPDDGASWVATERNVPAGYVLTTERRGNTFLLTNTLPSEPTEPPKTGDSANILLYTAIMYLSGMLLILLGILGKRKAYEK